jgi:uncharacterized protein YbcI
MADIQPPAETSRSHQSTSARISNAMVQTMREYTGRGPTQARTYLNDDVVVCIVKDTLTKGERKLADEGEVEAVLGLRRQYQSLMREDASKAIEEITGRRVVGFMSDNETDPDVAAEIFLLDAPPVREGGGLGPG